MNTAALRAVGSAFIPRTRKGENREVPDGRLPGIWKKSVYPIFSASAEIPWEQREKGMQDAQELYLRYGITTVQDGFTRALNGRRRAGQGEGGLPAGG